MRTFSAKVRVRMVAERQAGRVSAFQLTALGIESVVVVRWVADGYLQPVLPRVYAVGHRAPSVEADLWAAVLYAGPGAMLSHATALWWHGLLDHRPWPLQVTTPRRCRSLDGIRVYARRAHPRITENGLPTTSLEQALLDFAASAPIERIRYALANADFHKVLDIPALQVIAGRGRSGSTRLRKALTRHEPKLARTRSPLERTFVLLCERAGIPLPEVNVHVEGVLVDAVWRDRRLVVELDGRDNHSSWAQIQEDRTKEMRLRAADYIVIRYGTRQVEEELDLVAADLYRAWASSAARSA
jgi:predicted transcriptional regulator of viral defense system